MLCGIKKFIMKGAGWLIAVWVLAVITGALGCDSTGTEVGNPEYSQPNVPSDYQASTMASDEELENYLKTQYANSVNKNTGHGGEFGGGGGDASMPESPGGGTRPGDDAQPNSDSSAHSNTNLQEAGVDESDKVKTDGKFFYIVDGKSFHIVDISIDMEVVSTQTVEGEVDSLILYNDKLVVLYDATPRTDYGDQVPVMPDAGYGIPYWINSKMSQGVAIYDISDPRSPAPMKTVEFDGYLVSSRRIDGNLHLVQQFMPVLPQLDYWYDGTKTDLENKIASNTKAMEKMTLDQLIPHHRVVSDPEENRREGPTVATPNFYCPVSIGGGGTVTTIVTFNLDDTDLPFDSMGMVADGHIVYASTKALYVANHRYFWLEDIAERAMIYKFDLTGEQVRYAGSNMLSGWILNQFSLGEYEDVLRVAVTTGRAGGWGPTSKNHVYCLKSEDGALNVIGQLNDLAPGEQIYAARFKGHRGYLVTFVEIDPLFTLDLSDPASPKKVGELKVPGFSNYIHPYGDNHLITVGRSDRSAGVQLSIFDISDFSQPSLLTTETIDEGFSYTEAAFDHKAFAFWAEEELLALPIEINGYWDNGYRTHSFQGLYVYRVSKDNGFTFLGRIVTSPTSGDGAPNFRSPWTRGIFATDKVYAITPIVVKSALIDEINQGVQTIFLPKAEN